MRPEEIHFGLQQFDLGMNSGVAPMLLPPNQLAFAFNATVRGTLVKPRPPMFDYDLDFGGDSDAQNAFLNGLFQGACYYKPDGIVAEQIIVAVSGRLFQLTPNPATLTATVIEVTGAITNRQNATAPQHWLWQAEKWVIWNDGVSLPVFYDGTSCARSIGNNTVITPFTAKTTADFIAPPLASSPINFGTDIVNIATDNATVASSGTVVNFSGFGNLISFGSPSALHLNGLNTSAATPAPGFIPPGTVVPSGTTLTWGTKTITTLSQLPPGRMGAYGLGRNWMSLTDGQSFIASDIVGSSSGTAANDYRDAVLNVTENAFLVGGGVFRVPLSGGNIRAMIFATTLDASLGQGPLQIFTPNHVFSCQAPVDRLVWQSITNPILTESLIGAGALGQNSTVAANGDTLFRSLLGVSSLILARRDFDVWGNVPISREVSRVIDLDVQNLLPYGSAVIFDNRLLMTCSPQSSPLGIYHKGVVVINFDPLSTMQGKKASCWDGLWPGLNAFQLVVGEFDLVSRCFAIRLSDTNVLQLREIYPSATREIYDNGESAFEWGFEGPVMFNEPNPANRQYKRLDNGEIFVDDLQGTVRFQAFYKQDDWPCWTEWLTWEECATMNVENAQPQFRPRMGMGTPSGTPCDSSTGRPMREGYEFQFRLVVRGHCTFKGAKFGAIKLPEPKYAPPSCTPICET